MLHNLLITDVNWTGPLYKEKPADTYFVAEGLKEEGTLQSVGGVDNLVALAQYAGTSGYIEEYCSAVAKKSLMRQLFHTFQDLENKVVSGAKVEEPVTAGYRADDAPHP